MSDEKIFRDPLYNYISIDRAKDGWLLKLLDSPPMQRLRRIHQLGVSHFTYTSADHSRLSHSMGVLHLMQQALISVKRNLGAEDRQVENFRDALLATSLLHDVGHGPFSHVFEACLGVDHETWSCRIITDPEGPVQAILRDVHPDLPRITSSLIQEDNHEYPRWVKNLLSSQLDVDRLDYLRRDSLLTGAGYGHFDWFRILNTLRLWGPMGNGRDLVWSEKAALAIEEYVFSRYYMYWNVYLHKTTRGFEKLVEAVWKRAAELYRNGTDVALIRPIADFWGAKEPSVRQYLALTEAAVLFQMQLWLEHDDRGLSDLSRRFLDRDRLVAVEPPAQIEARDLDVENPYEEWEEALRNLVGSDTRFQPVESYCLRDNLKAKYTEPYFPERESDEQAVVNAIRLVVPTNSEPIEISELQPRLKPLTAKPKPRVRYYLPKEFESRADRLRQDWK
jgi:hypothetical protein